MWRKKVAEKKTVLIVDDHPLFREGLKTTLKSASGYEVIGESGTAGDALRMARELKPYVVLLDIALPDRSGIEIVQEFRRHLSNTQIMIISMHSKVDYVVKAFLAGATGYLAKESASERLLEGLDTISRGDYFMDSSVSRKVIQKLVQFPEKGIKITDARYDTLTLREQEVMGLLAQGLSPREIAEKLFISPKTVENHKSNIMRKLDLHKTIDLVRYATRLGIVDIDLWKE
jgi:DNA-binding NarL/FixJ family response regulator